MAETDEIIMGVCVCVFAKALLMFEVQNDTNVYPHVYSRILTVERTQCTFFNADMYATFFCTFTTNVLSHLVLVDQSFLH